MVQAGGDLDLAQEALGTDGSGQIRVQDLDRDLAVVLEILGEKHHGHAAATNSCIDRVPLGEGRLQAFEQVRHVATPRRSSGG